MTPARRESALRARRRARRAWGRRTARAPRRRRAAAQATSARRRRRTGSCPPPQTHTARPAARAATRMRRAPTPAAARAGGAARERHSCGACRPTRTHHAASARAGQRRRLRAARLRGAPRARARTVRCVVPSDSAAAAHCIAASHDAHSSPRAGGASKRRPAKSAMKLVEQAPACGAARRVSRAAEARCRAGLGADPAVPCRTAPRAGWRPMPPRSAPPALPPRRGTAQPAARGARREDRHRASVPRPVYGARRTARRRGAGTHLRLRARGAGAAEQLPRAAAERAALQRAQERLAGGTRRGGGAAGGGAARQRREAQQERRLRAPGRAPHGPQRWRGARRGRERTAVNWSHTRPKAAPPGATGSGLGPRRVHVTRSPSLIVSLSRSGSLFAPLFRRGLGVSPY